MSIGFTTITFIRTYASGYVKAFISGALRVFNVSVTPPYTAIIPDETAFVVLPLIFTQSYPLLCLPLLKPYILHYILRLFYASLKSSLLLTATLLSTSYLLFCCCLFLPMPIHVYLFGTATCVPL